MITITAPAKLNLYLHVTGKRENGYHELDSLVVFADYGDEIELHPADEYSLEIIGPFASMIENNDQNLVTKAVHALAHATGKTPDFKITLHKNLPVGAGIGGGSADAAATLKAVLQYWDINVPNLNDIALALGADVPVCLNNKPVTMRGIGELIDPLAMALPPFYALLVYPAASCSTIEIFKSWRGDFNKFATPDNWSSAKDFVGFLQQQQNDLTHAAIKQCPAIGDALQILEDNHATFTRMSGSGSTCFGLYEDQNEMQAAAKTIKTAHPDWWVQGTKIL
jgi:4-diphosphocytidyl-2-C-methyl-D-erythritol kinase